MASLSGSNSPWVANANTACAPRARQAEAARLLATGRKEEQQLDEPVVDRGPVGAREARDDEDSLAPARWPAAGNCAHRHRSRAPRADRDRTRSRPRRRHRVPPIPAERRCACPSGNHRLRSARRSRSIARGALRIDAGHCRLCIARYGRRRVRGRAPTKRAECSRELPPEKPNARPPRPASGR